MKITYLILCSILFSSLHSIAQNTRKFDPSNARDGETVEYCHQHIKMAELIKSSEFIEMNKPGELEFQQKLKEPTQKGTIYKIPVVFHVLHNEGVENISDEQIYDAMSLLNRDFRKQNADTANVHPDFIGFPSDVEIEFVLATKAPNGSCFKGITRTSSPMSYQGDDGGSQVGTIVQGNDVYNQSWAGNKYLNIFVCGEIGGAAGYTTNPGVWNATSMTNGIWVLHDYVGSIGTGSIGASRTLTHEVGHWLNLSHPWGGTNNPNLPSNCNTDDGVQDTPECIGVTSCNINSNSCNGDNAYWGFDMRDNVENYMDYSYCSKMFTAGQVARMRAALQVSSTGRSNLWKTNNLNATGATGALVLCEAAFDADRTTICAGNEVLFTDDSYNAVSSWLWTITPATGWSYTNGTDANSQNPSIIFNEEGLYTVKLNSSDGASSDIETKDNYIRVLPTAATLPFWEGFESYTSLENLTNWEVKNLNNNNAFSMQTSFGHTGNKCVKLLNYGQQPSNIDELISAPIDISGVPETGQVTLSFRYAYRKRTSSNYEFLKVFISKDCGENWAQRKTLGGNSLSSEVSSSFWEPSSQQDWTTVHMGNVFSDYFVENFRMRFKFEGEGGNNFYLDDINLYEGGSSNDIVVGLNEVRDDFNINLYPNPSEADVSVVFDLKNAQTMYAQVIDVRGKLIETIMIHANEGNNTLILDTKGLSQGSYTIKLSGETSASSLPFYKL
jgi:PKD repeat protein